MSLPNSSIDPKVVLKWYVEKLKYLRDNGVDFHETDSVRSSLRDYLETLALSIETIKEINYGLGSLFKLQVDQIFQYESVLVLDKKYINDAFDQLIKSLSVLVEQPLPILYKKTLNSSKNLKKSDSNPRRDLIIGLEIMNLVRWIIDFFHK